MALTTEEQPRSFIQIADGHMIKVLGHTESYKWFGCMLRAYLGQDSDVEYHIHQAAKLFQKHRGCKEWSIKNRVRCFEAIVSSTACFAPTFIQTTFTKNMTFNFESLFVTLWGIHGARIGQRDGMTSGTSGICVWITGPVPVKFCPGHRSV